jgi:AcrR family transcriptional regulator
MTADPTDNSDPSQPGPIRPKGRGRPPSIDQEELLDVARVVFLEKGFRATTQEVAERAGVSEGSLFHRFRTKEALFRSAMNLDPEELQEQVGATLASVRGAPIEEALTTLGRRLLDLGRLHIPLLMMTWSNPEPCSEPGHAERKVAYKQILYRVMAYFDEQVQTGKLRAIDTEALTRVFMGALHHYCMVRVMNPESENVMIPENMYLRGLVDLILHGALPPTSKAE